ncbi:MAG: hypothetical protein ACK481_03315 [Candidatus Melainabacteria bacterium]|jgi:hypothetical protein
MKEEIKMIEETIRRIERMLQAETNLDQIKKKEIMDLFQSLEFEIKKIPQENVDIARSITKFTEASTYEATRKTKNDNLLNLSIEGLKNAVTEYELTHPELVSKVNAFILALSGMGI